MMHEVVKVTPLTQLLIETDSPYLAPHPYRGKRNEPTYVVKVARQIAQLKECSLAEVAAQTWHNAHRVFNRGE
jgi:TatD DNase family protein